MSRKASQDAAKARTGTPTVRTSDGSTVATTPAPMEYDFHGHTVRVIMRDGEAWFVTKDVCDVLGISNSRDAVSELDDDEKGVGITDTPGGPQRVGIISEAGLYRLVMRSRKPIAKPFQRWVTHEVLPSVRRHGGYMLGQESMTPEEMVAASMRWLQSRIAEQRRQLDGLEARLAVAEPKATMLDEFTAVDGTMSVAQAAKDLSNTRGGRIGRDRLFARMAEWGWVYRSGGHWVACQRHVDAGHLVMKEHVAHGVRPDGTPFAYPPTVRVTRRGLALLREAWCAA